MQKTHIFEKKNNQKIFFTDLPSLRFFGLLQETNIFFLGLITHFLRTALFCFHQLGKLTVSLRLSFRMAIHGPNSVSLLKYLKID